MSYDVDLCVLFLPSIDRSPLQRFIVIVLEPILVLGVKNKKEQKEHIPTLQPDSGPSKTKGPKAFPRGRRRESEVKTKQRERERGQGDGSTSSTRVQPVLHPHSNLFT